MNVKNSSVIASPQRGRGNPANKIKSYYGSIKVLDPHVALLLGKTFLGSFQSFYRKHFLLISLSVSALAGVLPYIFPYLCAELVFVFLVPLFILIGNSVRLGFRAGFFWGILFYNIYFLGLGDIIFRHGAGPLRLCAYSALVFYGAFFSAVWFYVSATCMRWLHRTNSECKIFCCAGITMGYMWWHDRLFFWIFGQMEGDTLHSFVVPLAARPAWLLISSYATHLGCLFLIIFFAACLASFFTARNSFLSLTGAFVCFIPFASGWLFHGQTRAKPGFLEKSVCLIPRVEHDDPWQCHEQICELLETCAKHADYIVLPESSLPFILSEYQRCITSWYDIIQNDNAYIIMGSHRKEDNNLYNSFFILHRRRIIHHYDKTHLMFFTERVPSHLKGLKNLFLKSKTPFSQGKMTRAPIHLPELGALVPYVCSELFFEPLAYWSYGDRTEQLFCLVNDSWFFFSYVPELMFLYAVNKAIFERKTILYVSHRKGVCIMPDGTLFHLTRAGSS